MKKAPLLLDEDLPKETGDIADACAAVPSSTGYGALIQTLLRGRMTSAAIALVIRQIAIMALSVGSSVAVSRWIGPESSAALQF